MWQAKDSPFNHFADRQAEALALQSYSELASVAVLGAAADLDEAWVLG
jgi:hypothetical protein